MNFNVWMMKYLFNSYNRQLWLKWFLNQWFSVSLSFRLANSDADIVVSRSVCDISGISYRTDLFV